MSDARRDRDRNRGGALAREHRPDRPLRSARRRAGAARAPARRAVARGVGDHAGLGHGRGARRRRHGRLGDRWRAGASRDGRSRFAPDLHHARIRAAAVDDARHDGAVRELLRRDRGDARLLRVGRRAGRQAHGGHHRRTPRRDGARGRRARDSATRRLSAARRRRVHDRRLARGRGAVRRRTAADIGDRRRGIAHRAPRRRVGPRRRRGLAREDRRAWAGRHDAGDRRGWPDQPDRLPLEDADQRERKAARLLERTARARPQRDRRLGRGAASSGASPRCSSTTPTRTRASRSAWR